MSRYEKGEVFNNQKIRKNIRIAVNTLCQSHILLLQEGYSNKPENVTGNSSSYEIVDGFKDLEKNIHKTSPHTIISYNIKVFIL